jgi:predicted metal-dependent phosphoesterase TrpH
MTGRLKSKSAQTVRSESVARAITRVGADLHVHTTHSDGVCSPCEVAIAAAGVGLSALAITDHDTVSALPIARPEADRLGIELIAGVELSCVLDGRELHLLGHFFRDDNADLLEAMSTLRAGRTRRLEMMVERLNAHGLAIEPAALRRAFPRAVLGRRHLALFLERTGQVASVREVFARFLADGQPCCVDKPCLDIFEAIGLVNRAGGVAALAHPPFDLRVETLRRLTEARMGAIEVGGPGISNRLARRFRDWAAQFCLVPIAGSDFHAPDRPGRWVGAIVTPQADLDRLRLVRPKR